MEYWTGWGCHLSPRNGNNIQNPNLHCKKKRQVDPVIQKEQWLFGKSAYHKTKDASLGIGREHPANNEPTRSETWPMMWKLKTPPRVKRFMWWFQSNALAVGTNLRTRGMSVDPRCHFCNQEESTNHMLLGCNRVTPIWFGTLGICLYPTISTTLEHCLKKKRTEPNLTAA